MKALSLYRIDHFQLCYFFNHTVVLQIISTDHTALLIITMIRRHTSDYCRCIYHNLYSNITAMKWFYYCSYVQYEYIVCEEDALQCRTVTDSIYFLLMSFHTKYSYTYYPGINVCRGIICSVDFLSVIETVLWNPWRVQMLFFHDF